MMAYFAMASQTSLTGTLEASLSSPFVDSDEDDVELEKGGVGKRRKRSNIMTSMPGSLEDDGMDGADEPEEGYGCDVEGECGENEEAAEIFYGGEDENVAFL